jgi:ADP-ribosylglycohydrolase
LTHDDSDIQGRALERTLFDKTVGISELLFEVVYGASEGLHSRAKECLEQLLIFNKDHRTPDQISLIRCLFIKLINEVDTEKHQLIYDTITKTLNWKESQGDLTLLLTMTQDIIKLKHGRRVTQYGIVSMTEFLNTML